MKHPPEVVASTFLTLKQNPPLDANIFARGFGVVKILLLEGMDEKRPLETITNEVALTLDVPMFMEQVTTPLFPAPRTQTLHDVCDTVAIPCQPTI